MINGFEVYWTPNILQEVWEIMEYIRTERTQRKLDSNFRKQVFLIKYFLRYVDA